VAAVLSTYVMTIASKFTDVVHNCQYLVLHKTPLHLIIYSITSTQDRTPGLATYRSWVRMLPRHHFIVALGKLLTPVWLFSPSTIIPAYQIRCVSDRVSN